MVFAQSGDSSGMSLNRKPHWNVFKEQRLSTPLRVATPNPEYTLPVEVKNLVMHTRLNISGSNVMFSDVFPGSPFVAGNNISLAVVSKDMEEIKSYFSKLKEVGTVGMDLQETFWSKCYRSLKDKFGIEWQISHENDNTII